MRKAIFIILIVSILSLALTACSLDSNDNLYKNLNQMAKDDFPIVKLEVATTYNGTTLVNKYNATTASNGTIVRYTVQTLSKIVENEDGSFTIPEEMIKTESGSASIVNGKITILNGDMVDIPINALENLSINFNEKYFEGVKVEELEDGTKRFTATVSNIQGFTGNSNFDGKNMTINVVYGNYIQSLIVNYTMADGATVKVTYNFTKAQ